MSAVIEGHHDDHHHGPAKGITRWLYTTNHKDIGSLYLWFSFIMLFIGGAMAMVIRAELFEPGSQIVSPEFYNQMVTNHGLIMVFGVIMPAFVGLANWLIPMQIGAPDMALPRLNNLSFWILPAAFGVLLATFFMEGGAPNFGWTFYAPLSTEYAPPTHSNLLYFCCAHYGSFFHHGFNQRDNHNFEYESTRHDSYENASICMVLVNYCLLINSSDAGSCWSSNNDVDGHPFWHQFL